jgi:hypothetical protein
MVEAMSFALWATANHLTSMCDQLKTSICTLNPYQPITPSEHEIWNAVDECQWLVDEVMVSTFGL